MTAPAPERLAAVLIGATHAMNAATGEDQTLDAIAQVARRVVPGFEHVSITLNRRDGHFETCAATSDLSRELDSVQYDLQAGPCLEAIRTGPVVLSAPLRDDHRWPGYVEQAGAVGVRAQMGVQLRTSEETLGGLNFYSTEDAAVDPGTPALAELLAASAAVAIRHARQETQLSLALETRRTIGQAIGIAMERYQISSDRAFQYLVRASQTSNLKLKDIAEELVEHSDRRYSAAPPQP